MPGNCLVCVGCPGKPPGNLPSGVGGTVGRMVGGTVGGMARGTVGGMVSLATRQTPWIDDNTPARGGIIMYNGGLAGG